MRLVPRNRPEGRGRRRTAAIPGALPARLTVEPAARPAERCVAPPIAPEPLPVWLSALMAAPCMVAGDAGKRAIRWTWVDGRAVYTNAGRAAEWIESFGVQLPAGHTLAVCWVPGETAYTTEVFTASERCA